MRMESVGQMGADKGATRALPHRPRPWGPSVAYLLGGSMNSRPSIPCWWGIRRSRQ